MPLITDPRRLRRAARACMRRCSAPGADQMRWADLRRAMPAHLDQLAQALRDGTWRPGPLREVELTAYTGKRFTAVVPTVVDRVVQRVLRDAITPVLEDRVLAGFVSGWARPGRNRMTAIRHATEYLQSGLGWIADVDVAAVSAGASVDTIIDIVSRWVHDGTFLDRFRTALLGLPHPLVAGTVLAPTLLNVRLTPVDHQVADLPVVRFADNYTAFAPDIETAIRASGRIVDALANVGLRPASAKSRIRHANPEDLYLIAG